MYYHLQSLYTSIFIFYAVPITGTEIVRLLCFSNEQYSQQPGRGGALVENGNIVLFRKRLNHTFDSPMPLICLMDGISTLTSTRKNHSSVARIQYESWATG